jgi:hypothetical protein
MHVDKVDKAETRRAASEVSDQLICTTPSSKDWLYCKSASRMNRGTDTNDFLRCKSEEITPTPWFVSKSQRLDGRSSHSPANDFSINAESFISMKESVSTAEIKRKWRSRRIAHQQKLIQVQAQISWWSRWIQRTRCALSILHRQK